jgi:hypothetical protein
MWFRIGYKYESSFPFNVVVESSVDNLTQVFMQATLMHGGFTKDLIGNMLWTFGVDGVFVFQGIRLGVTS